jgi:hypothetical protein
MPTEPEKTKSLVKQLMDHLYTSITDGEDGQVAVNQKERFITWCLPGIPFALDGLRFTTDLFNTRPAAATADPAAPPGSAPISDDELLRQAAEFAKLVNFVPEVSSDKLVAYHRNESSMSSIFERVLAQSQVAQADLSAEEVEKIKKFRGLLFEQRKKKNIVTDEITEETEDSAVVKVYEASRVDYEQALTEFNNVRLTGGNHFALNGPMLRRRVDSVRQRWSANGFKNEVEQMRAFIEQVTQRDLSLWKSDVQARFESCRLAHPTLGEFFSTTLIPGDFWKRDAGWTDIKVTHDKLLNQTRASTSSTGAAGAVSLGLVTVGGTGKTTTTSDSEQLNLSNFQMRYKVAQIPISRPWFDTFFLQSRAWRLNANAVELHELSDGAMPPQGDLPAYVTSVVFAKDIAITSTQIAKEASKLAKSFGGSGGLGIGPFYFGGKHSSDSTETNSSIETDGEWFKTEGMQIIAFRCHAFDQMPNPDPRIERWT